MLKYVQSPQ